MNGQAEAESDARLKADMQAVVASMVADLEKQKDEHLQELQRKVPIFCLSSLSSPASSRAAVCSGCGVP